jgi:cell division protein FtsN
MKNAAPAKSTKRQTKSGGGMLLGIFLGLVAGVLIAFGIVWYLNKTPLPFQDKSGRAEKTPEKSLPAGEAKAPEPLPGKPGDKVGEKPRFEFYKILPGGQEATPAPAPAPAATGPAPAVAAAAAPGESFYLQAGAFQKAADADNLKAKLALLGVEVAVQETAVPDKGTMYRVRVGPYAKPEDMNRARNQLAQNGIQSTVVKIKDNPKN